jgi:hypothetical protein
MQQLAACVASLPLPQNEHFDPERVTDYSDWLGNGADSGETNPDAADRDAITYQGR